MDIRRRTASPFGLSAFSLKLLAAVTMVVDHIGAYLLPNVIILRIIGRLSFPLFAFFIAEGCRYTRNRLRRFLLVLGLALVCEVGYLAISHELTGTALLTFSCSIPIIYTLQAFKHALVRPGTAVRRAMGILLAATALAVRRAMGILLAATALAGATILGYAVSVCVPIDYGFPGVLLPVMASLTDYREGKAPACLRQADRHPLRLGIFTIGLLAVWYFRGHTDLQLYSLLALIPLALYNGRPGPRRFKYWFYLFYPAHLAVIWLIGALLKS